MVEQAKTTVSSDQLQIGLGRAGGDNKKLQNEQRKRAFRETAFLIGFALIFLVAISITVFKSPEPGEFARALNLPRPILEYEPSLQTDGLDYLKGIIHASSGSERERFLDLINRASTDDLNANLLRLQNRSETHQAALEAWFIEAFDDYRAHFTEPWEGRWKLEEIVAAENARALHVLYARQNFATVHVLSRAEALKNVVTLNEKE